MKQREYNKRNFYLRAVNEIYDSFKLLIKVKKENADVYIISLPSMFLLFAYVILRKKEIVYDIRDLVWKYIKNKNIIMDLLEKTALYILSKSRLVTVTNENELKYLESNYVYNTIKISNGINNSRFKKLCDIKLKDKGSNKKYELIYIGNIGYAQKLQEIIDVVGQMENYNLRIIGKGNELNRLLEYVKSKKFKNITFLGYMPWNNMIEFIKASDCLIGQIGQEFESAIPSKLYEYAVCGRNIVFGLPDGAANNIIKDFKGFNIYSTGDSKTLKELLLQVKSFNISQENIDYNRKHVSKHFIREKEALKLVSKIKEEYEAF